jgi:3-oxoacyl-[acyl-carrier protein] reductase
MESLKGRTALITGAGKGIGREVALALAKEGVKLGLLANSTAQLEDIEAELKHFGVKVSTVTADITDIHSVILAVDKLEQEIGAIDILINSEDTTFGGPFMEFDPILWENNLKMNLLGFYYLTQAVMPSMVLKSAGDIITISSKSDRRNPGEVTNFNLPESLMDEVVSNNIRYKAFTAQDIKEFTLTSTEGIVEKSQDVKSDFAGYLISQLKTYGGLNLQDSVMISSNPS